MDPESQDPARYVDDRPANLPAAAADALEWLEWMRGNRVFDLWEWRSGKHRGDEGKFYRLQPPARDEGYVALGGCIRALEELLRPHLPAVQEQSRQFPDAVAVMAASSGERTDCA